MTLTLDVLFEGEHVSDIPRVPPSDKLLPRSGIRIWLPEQIDRKKNKNNPSGRLKQRGAGGARLTRP